MVWTPAYNGRWSLAEEDLPVDLARRRRRGRGRPQQSWNNQVTDFIGSRKMEDDKPEDRDT
jgi:hypothetical protein